MQQPIGAQEVATPAWMQAIEHLPGVGVGVLWNTNRVSNTIVGGLGREKSIFGKSWAGKWEKKHGLRNTLRPHFWRRFGSYDGLLGKEGAYVPFHSARFANGAAGKISGKAAEIAASDGRLAGEAEKLSGAMTAHGEKEKLFGTGVLGRTSAIARVNANGATKGTKAFLAAASDAGAGLAGGPALNGPARQWVAHSSAILGEWTDVAAGTRAGSTTGHMVGIAATGTGKWAQRWSGYQIGALRGTEAGEAISKASKVGLEHLATGYANAAEDLTSAGLKVVDGTLMRDGAKTGAGRVMGRAVTQLDAAGFKIGAARMASGFSKVAGPIGWAMIGYDLGNLAGAGIKGGINLAGDAAKSLQGSLNKPVMGMGYKDTQVAATSRARGVMAIQNSRLNARSMLGSEAGQMAAHFG